jgi:hypothetical protein
VWVLKAPEKEKHTNSAGGLTCTHHAPFVFPSLTFNKPHLHPCILLGFFHAGMQGPRSSENTVANRWLCEHLCISHTKILISLLIGLN